MNKEGKIIGFGGQFYTLWNYRVEGIYETDAYGKHHLVRNKTNYFYIKNISIDIEKVKNLYPDLAIDKGLKGYKSFSYENYEQDLCPELIKFGKYRGKTIYEITNLDLGYSKWLVRNAFNWRTKWLLMQIPELYNSINAELQKQKERLKSWKILDGEIEVTFATNPNGIVDRYYMPEFANSYPEFEYKYFARVQVEENNNLLVLIPEVVKIGGGKYQYNMAVINGKKMKLKNKTMKLNIKNIFTTKTPYYCQQIAILN